MKDNRTPQEKIWAAIREYNMFAPGDAVIAGVSGGADSMAMLHFLCENAAQMNIHVVAAHVNHGIRGQEAQRDETFVANWCAARGIPCRIHRADVPALAAANGQGLEECGRLVRYRFFEQLVEQLVGQLGGGQVKIATAHTCSDHAETVLLHLARGAGGKGLCGIAPVRGNIVRPVIGLTRQEIEAYCAQYDVAYVNDSTNQSLEYARNRIRHEVIPVLKELNPALEQAVWRLSQVLRQDDACLQAQAADLLDAAKGRGGYRADSLAKAPQAVRSRALAMLARREGASPEYRHIRRADQLLAGQGGVNLPGGVTLQVRGGWLKPVASALGNEEEQALWQRPFATGEILTGWHKTFIIEVVERFEYDKRLKFNKKLFNRALDYDTIPIDAVVRNRRQGDTFRQAGRGVTKTLKKLFGEAKVQQEKRSRLLLLARENKVIWAEGFGAAEGFAVNEVTSRVALILSAGPDERQKREGIGDA